MAGTCYPGGIGFHMPAGYTKDFFIEGRYYGSARLLPRYVKAELCAPPSQWFLCPVCGELWARFSVPGPRATWEPIIRCCRKDGGGSIWRPWDAEYTEALPAPVLQWELERELDYFTLRNRHGQNQS